jgi:hypothetical protein
MSGVVGKTKMELCFDLTWFCWSFVAVDLLDFGQIIAMVVLVWGNVLAKDRISSWLDFVLLDFCHFYDI